MQQPTGNESVQKTEKRNLLPWGRIALVAVAMLLQVAILIRALRSVSELSPLINLALLLISVIVSIGIWNSEVNASYKFPWIILIMLFPVGGGILYLIAGVPKFNRWGLRRYTRSSHLIKSLLFERLPKRLPAGLAKQARRQATLLNNLSGYPVYTATKTRYFSSGEAQFREMFADLRRAEKFIFIEYFIISSGRLWDECFAILKEKAAAGVDVRLVYDDIGSIWNLPPRFLKTLKQAGIKGKVFNPLAALPSFIFNNRNHRKIVVIDGEIAYTGGTNLADEYVNLIERFGHWKDAAIRLEGPAVWSFTVMFLSLWNHLCRHDVHREDQFQTYAPSDLRNHLTSNEDEAAGMQSADQGYLIPYDDIPDDNKSVGVDTYHTMIQQAEHSIFIMTPYLVIDDEMIRSLTLAAAGGVEVIIITPHIPDKPYVLETTRSYYSKLIEHGVRIFEYTPGFIHSKVVLVDDCLAVVGTINFDYRSFYLHLECAVWMYQTECIPDIRRDFDQTLTVSQEITSQDLQYGFPKRFLQAFLRMFAPLM